jgi:hypothetical protein
VCVRDGTPRTTLAMYFWMRMLESTGIRTAAGSRFPISAGA